MNIITKPLVWLLFELNNITGNMGLAIIALTLMIRAALLPLTLPAMKSQNKIRELQPQLNALKGKFGDDKIALAQAQQALYKENKINPLSGCLPYLLQFAVLIALYQVLRQFLGDDANGLTNNIYFLGLDLTQRDTTYILPVLAAGAQFLLSMMIMPGANTRNIIPDESKSKKARKANEKEESMADMAGMMQKQMMYVMPVMTGVFAATFPAGLAVYWVTTTVFSVVQQYFISGLGGLAKYIPGHKEKDFTVETLEAVAEENKLADKSKDKAESKVKSKSKTSGKSKLFKLPKKSSGKSEVEADFASAFMKVADTSSKGSGVKTKTESAVEAEIVERAPVKTKPKTSTKSKKKTARKSKKNKRKNRKK